MITYTKNLAQNSGYNREEHVSNEHPVKQRQNACPRIFHTVPYNQINSGKGRKGAHVPQDFNRMKKWKRCHLNIISLCEILRLLLVPHFLNSMCESTSLIVPFTAGSKFSPLSVGGYCSLSPPMKLLIAL